MLDSIYAVREDGHIFALAAQSDWDTDKFREFVERQKASGYIVYQLGSRPWSKEIYINFTNRDIPDWFTSIL